MRISSVKIVSICIGNPALDPIQEDCRHFQRVRVAVGLAAAEPRGRLATSSHAPAMSSIVQSIFGSGQRTMEASQEDLQNAKIPLGYRDFCAHLLVPLNACRRKELYLPWKCEHERHAYEKCEYLEYKRRLKHAKESH